MKKFFLSALSLFLLLVGIKCLTSVSDINAWRSFGLTLSGTFALGIGLELFVRRVIRDVQEEASKRLEAWLKSEEDKIKDAEPADDYHEED